MNQYFLNKKIMRQVWTGKKQTIKADDDFSLEQKTFSSS